MNEIKVDPLMSKMLNEVNELGWEYFVSSSSVPDKFGDKIATFIDLNKKSPAGLDFYIQVALSDPIHMARNFYTELVNEKNVFDVDAYVEVYAGYRGKRSIPPATFKGLIEDAEKVKDMISELVFRVGEILETTERQSNISREILFKAKMVDNGKWIEGNLLHLKNKDLSCPDTYYIIPKTSNADFVKALFYFVKPLLCEVEPGTVCQCTGLTDKNGDKIWENDVVKLQDGILSKVEWHEIFAKFVFTDLFCGLTRDLLDTGSKIEIIGNIFDNSELDELINEKK